MIQQKDMFERIFGGAQLVDIDLSTWDKKIALYVLADHMGYTMDGRLPMFVAEFSLVRRFYVQFKHFDKNPPIELGPDEHVQWVLYEFRVQNNKGKLDIRLWGHAASPELSILCSDVSIRRIENDTPDRYFPGWNKPFSGFIRPGLDAWLQRAPHNQE